MKNFLRCSLIFIMLLTLKSCEQKYSTIQTDGAEKVEFRALPFDIADVKLLDGPFLHATTLNMNILLNYDPNRLLAKFRTEAGLEPKVEHYEGWEGMSLAGHSLGHYLSACSMMFRTTGDTVFYSRVKTIINELSECQNNEGSGYLGAVPGVKKIFEEEIAKGNIRSGGFDLNGIWAPIYTQHKILAGLLDAYEHCGIQRALDVAKKFADWMNAYISQMNQEQIQEMLHCEHGGINEALANLYALTGEKKYLDLSLKFYHEEILTPLSQRMDILPGKHANTQIPKLIGLARIYELTGDTLKQNTAAFFWNRVVNHHSYVTGGHCNHEYFGAPDSLRDRLSENTTETCNVYNMLKLSRHLFEWNASAQTADFYERALFNHILSAQHPETGRVIYNLSLEMGGYKIYQDPEWFTCCVGSGMETHAKYAANIYFYNHEELFVSQFIASELQWKEKQITLIQNTSYPDEQGTNLEIKTEKPVNFSLNIRFPYWAESGISVTLNGKPIKVKNNPGSFICLSRTWKNGDKIKVSIPFSLRTEAMPDDSMRVSFLYGPLVLAGLLGEIEDSGVSEPDYVPVFVAEKDKIFDHIVPDSNESNVFRTKNIGRPHDLKLVPFYKMHDKRYSVYWDIFNEDLWLRQQEEYKAELERRKKTEQLTIDFFQPGEMQPERDHNFKGDDVWVEEHRGRKYRMANNCAMSCEMKTNNRQHLALMVEYWAGFPGAQKFDILVDGKKIATEDLSNRNINQFISVIYDIPAEILQNKNKIEVSFAAWKGLRAGPLFGVRTIMKEE